MKLHNGYPPQLLNSVKTRIIIVEDHPIYREGINMTLSFSDLDCEVVAQANDVRQAIDYIETHPEGIDLAILDYFLPDGNGGDVLATLKAFSPNAKSLILSGDVEHPNVQELAKQGVSGIISKDAQSTELLQVVKSVIEGKKAMGAFSQSQFDSAGSLTSREIEIIRMMAHGKRIEEIAAALGISPKTVKRHKENIYLKTGTSSSVELFRYAIKSGLL